MKHGEGKPGVDGRRSHATHAADAQVRTYVTAPKRARLGNKNNEAWFNSAAIAASYGSWRKSSNYCPQSANRRMAGGVACPAMCTLGLVVGAIGGAIAGASISFVLFAIFATKAE
jgi:hypothetical protein